MSVRSQYWQQEVNHAITVSLNDKEHTLTGFQKIHYKNNSPKTLDYIWIHLWPNAYKSDMTAFSDQLLENGNTRFYFSEREQKGYINRLAFKVDGITARVEDHPEHIDIIKLILPGPLLSGKSVEITTPFHVKLPFNYSRGGHDGQSYQVTQWFPKPAVYDKDGWHPMPYLDQGEFYSDFGSYDVSITVPENYVVAATGELQNEDEKAWLKTRTSFQWTPVKKKIKTKGGSYKTIVDKFPPSATGIKILRFKQDRVHDFAWFADKRFIVNSDTCRLPSGKMVDIYTYTTPEENFTWANTRKNAKDALLHYSTLVGEYPYNIVSVVQGPQSFGGGMEYPTITVIAPTNNGNELDLTIAHEIGHNWFYGILASNEREHPWMDEGINTFYENKYARTRTDHFDERFERVGLATQIAEYRDQPIETTSEKFSETNYNLVGYYKAGKWMEWLESLLGTATFQKAMQEYYARWQFKHPQPADLKKTLEDVSGRNLDSAFALLSETGPLPGSERKGIALLNPVQWAFDGYERKNSVITLLPSVGMNSYDKLMGGVMITNLRLPTNRFQFFAAPMYAFGSKRFTGIGFANYSLFSGGVFRKIELGLNASTFTADRFTDEDGNKTFLGFTKLSPRLRLTFKQKDPRSTLKKFIQLRSYMISEDQLRFYRDTVIVGVDTTISNKFRTQNSNRTLNQVKFVIDNGRALYPYRAELNVEQGKHFVRAAFTGNYFFNYVKEGGLNVRFFAGKFFYTSSRTFTNQFATDRYHLNMTGPNGYEDYTYSDYFIGRNEFEGVASQQIMVRDGGFKVRTDLLAEKVGRTDDWLIAANLSSTIPSAINPLSLLPFRIPLKLFVDIGTYSEPWEKNSTLDRFVYDAGIQVSFLKETINLYFPVLYSKVYKEYIESTIPKKGRFGKTISFSIDISNFNLKKVHKFLDF